MPGSFPAHPLLGGEKPWERGCSNANPSLSPLPPGSFRCAKSCATFPYISDGLTNYTFFPPAKHVPLTLICLVKLKTLSA